MKKKLSKKPVEEKLVMPSKFGFIAPKIDATHWTFKGFSASPRRVINPDADWREFLPQGEIQENSFLESNGCGVFGTLNALEMLAKAQFGKDWNKSERYTGSLVGVTEDGSDPHEVAECIRKNGTVPEKYMAFSDAIQSFADMWNVKEARKLLPLGKTWLTKYKLNHDWVFGGVKEMKEALKVSPLGVSGFAWAKDENGLFYTPEGQPDIHWFVLTYIEDQGYEKDNYFEVFDSYPPYTKKLRFDYSFGWRKVYTLTPVTTRLSFWDWFFSLLAKKRVNDKIAKKN